MALSPTLRDSAKWARIAYQLDRELGPITFQALPMRDGESVSDWRQRNQSALKAHLAKLGAALLLP